MKRPDQRVVMLRTLALFILILSFHCVRAQVTFVIESLPSATPASDTIYITGTFNEWITNDPRYALQRQLNGQLAITLPLKGTHEYKFTRGGWTKVETNNNNQYIENRKISTDKAVSISIRIENWLDLGGAKQLNYWIFYFFACAFQCLALCLLVYRIEKVDRHKLKTFLITNFLMVGLLVMLTLHQITDQIWQSYVTFILQIIFFCWGPLVLFFINGYTNRSFKIKLIYFVPAMIVLAFTFLRILNIPSFEFLSTITVGSFTTANMLIFAGGFIYNLAIYYKGYKLSPFFLNIKNIRDPKEIFLSYFFWISLLALLFIPINILLILSGGHYTFIEDFNFVAIILSSLIFLETYYHWRFPEIIKEEKIATPLPDNLQQLAERLNAFMSSEKPFKKVDLSISELADMVGIKAHNLSRVINEYHQKNFRDFVNGYRIQEFIELANTKEFKHYTFLALAQEVGFNSKSTFNLAFKKALNVSPREYFKKAVISDEELD